jgi:hypothetical protein
MERVFEKTCGIICRDDHYKLELEVRRELKAIERQQVKANANAGSKHADPSPEAEINQGDNNLLSLRAREALKAMLQLNAVDSDSRRSAEEITQRAMDKRSDALKPVLLELKEEGFVLSKTGRGGGYWLTAKGRDRASGIGKRNSETR